MAVREHQHDAASRCHAPGSTARSARAPFLAADVGGTHARMAIVRAGAGPQQVEIEHYHKYVCAQWPGLDAIMRDFFDRHGGTSIRECALACAGYAIDDQIINVNLPWIVNLSALRESLGFSELTLANDFESLAHAALHLDDEAAVALNAEYDIHAGGPRVILGPGTGLGTAVVFPDRDPPLVLATEAGQTGLAPGTALEREILAVLAREREHVSIEDAVSGPGLLNLYRALAEIEDMPCVLDTPEVITRSAQIGNDALARRALNCFCGLLGSFAGDLAMLYGAGAVWLAGGILPQLREFLARSDFRARFLAKGRMRPVLERVSVRMIEHGRLGVIGAAYIHLGRSAARIPGHQAGSDPPTG